MFIKYLLYSGMLPLYPQTDGFLRIISFLKLLEVLTGSSNASNFLRLLFPEMFAKMALNSKLSPNYAALFWHSSDTSDYRSFTRFGYRRVKEQTKCHYLLVFLFLAVPPKESLESLLWLTLTSIIERNNLNFQTTFALRLKKNQECL